MADSSWDNGGQGAPVKAGMPLWAKITMGCGVAFLLAVVTCVGAGAFFVNKVKKDPEGFKKQVLGFAIDKMKPEWDDFRAVMDQLRTPEGCKALYAANPALAKTWPTEGAFLEAAATWRKDLAPTPELTPELMEQHGLRMNKSYGGRVEVGWSPKEGRAVYVTFDRARLPGETGPRHVLELDVR